MFDDLIEKSVSGASELVETYNYRLSGRRIDINYKDKTILVTGGQDITQKWIVDKFKEISHAHRMADVSSPFQKTGKFAILEKDWSVGIDNGNGNIKP